MNNCASTKVAKEYHNHEVKLIYDFMGMYDMVFYPFVSQTCKLLIFMSRNKLLVSYLNKSQRSYVLTNYQVMLLGMCNNKLAKLEQRHFNVTTQTLV
jgi:hypothetical protein